MLEVRVGVGVGVPLESAATVDSLRRVEVRVWISSRLEVALGLGLGSELGSGLGLGLGHGPSAEAYGPRSQWRCRRPGRSTVLAHPVHI